MPAINFNEVFTILKDGIAAIARDTVTEYARQATAEGQKALAGIKSDLERWTQQLADGDLNEKDIEFVFERQKRSNFFKRLKPVFSEV